MKVLSEDVLDRRVCKRFEIELKEGVVVSLTKWSDTMETYGGTDYDSDWEFDSEEDRKKYKALTDEEQDEFNDFISGLEI